MISSDPHNKLGEWFHCYSCFLDKETWLREARSLAQCQPTIKWQSQDGTLGLPESKALVLHCPPGYTVTRGEKLLERDATQNHSKNIKYHK